MTQPVTLEKVIEHHLTQNIGQKITPHLVAGLALLMSEHIRKLTAQPAQMQAPSSQEMGAPHHD